MKRLLFLVVILALCVQVQAQRKLTLDEAISIALNKNYSLIKQKNSLQSTEGSVKSAIGALVPSLNLTGGFNWAYSTSSQDFFGSFLSSTVTTETRKYTMGANSSWTLFDGLSSWARLSQSQDNLEAAKLSLEKAKQDIVYNTTDYYYSMISAIENYKISEENLKYNKKMLEQIETKQQLGSVAIADVYQWRYNVGNAELSLINAKNNIDKAKITFLNYLSLELSEDYELVDPNPTPLYEGSDVNNMNLMLQEAFATRKDYLAQKYILNVQQSATTIASSRYLPRVSLSGGFSTDAAQPGKLFDKRLWNAGLSVSWAFSVVDYFYADQSIQNAKINILNAEEDLRNLERTIKADVKQSVLDYQAALKATEVADANLVSATQSKNISVEKYNQGSGTILDVLNGDNAYIQAAYNKIFQKFQLYRAKDRLMRALGKLDYQKYDSK